MSAEKCRAAAPVRFWNSLFCSVCLERLQHKQTPHRKRRSSHVAESPRNMVKCVRVDIRTEILSWLTACFRCTDAQFLCHILPRRKCEHALWALGLAALSVLHLVVKVDGQAGGVHVRLGVEFGSRFPIGALAFVVCFGTGGGLVHVCQQNTGHVLPDTNIHLSGVRGRKPGANHMMMLVRNARTTRPLRGEIKPCLQAQTSGAAAYDHDASGEVRPNKAALISW